MPVKDPNEDPIASGSSGKGCLITFLVVLGAIALSLFVGSLGQPGTRSSDSANGWLPILVVIEYWPLILVGLLFVGLIIAAAVASKNKK
jgi:amino acid transporter